MRIAYLNNTDIDDVDLEQFLAIRSRMAALGHEVDLVLLKNRGYLAASFYDPGHVIGMPPSPLPLTSRDMQSEFEVGYERHAIPGSCAEMSLGHVRRAELILVHKRGHAHTHAWTLHESIALTNPHAVQYATPNPNLDDLLEDGLVALANGHPEKTLGSLQVEPAPTKTVASELLRYLRHNLLAGGAPRAHLWRQGTTAHRHDMSAVDALLLMSLGSVGGRRADRVGLGNLFAGRELAWFNVKFSSYSGHRISERWGNGFARVAYASLRAENLAIPDFVDYLNELAVSPSLPVREIGRFVTEFLAAWNAAPSTVVCG